MRGCFVAFEGLDGSGKTTQLDSARAWLAQRHEVSVTREPGGTAVAEAIRHVVLDPTYLDREPSTDAFLMNAARRDLCMRVIQPALDAASIVLSDRFAASTRAYQGGGDGVQDDWLERLELLATGGLEPDRYLLFDIDVEIGLARRYGDGEVNAMDRRDVEFHRRVRDAFLAMARAAPDQWSVIDASGDIADVRRQVRDALADVLTRRGLDVPS